MLRFLKIIGLLFLCLVILWIGAYYYLRIKYTPERIRTLAEKMLSKQLQRKVTLEQADIHPTSGILLRGLTVYQKAPDDTLVFAHVAEVQLRYRLWSILKRHLEIHQIRIIKPHVYWRSELSASTIGSISQPKLTPPGSAVFSKTELPVHISLREFLLQNFKLDFTVVDSAGHLQGTIDGLNVKLTNLSLPRGSIDEFWRALKFRLQVNTNEGQIVVYYQPQIPFQLGTWSSKTVMLNSKWQLRFFTQTAYAKNIDFHGQLQLQQPQLKLFGVSEAKPFQNYFPDLKAEWKGLVDLDSLNVILKILKAGCGKWFDFEGQGKLGRLLNHPRIQCDFAPVVIRFRPLNEWLQTLHLPAPLQIPDFKMKGEYRIEKASMQGTLSPSEFQIKLIYKSVLSDFGLISTDYPLELAGAHWELKASGAFGTNGFQKGHIQGKVKIPGFRYALNDTAIVQPKSLDVNYEVLLGTHFVPQHLNFMTAIDDIFSGDAFLFADITVSGAQTLAAIGVENLTGTAELQIRNLDLETLTAGNEKGNFDFHSLLTTNYGYKGFLTFDLHGKDLEYLTDEGYETLPELFLTGKGSLVSTKGFQKISLKAGSFQLNDLLTGKLTILLEKLGKKVTINVDPLLIDHNKLRPFLPSYLRETLKTAQWQGQTQVQIEMNGWLDEQKRFQNNLSGRFSIENYSFDYPEAFLTLDSLRIRGELLGTLNQIQTSFKGKLLAFNVTDAFPEPMADTRIEGSAVLSNFDRLEFSGIEIHQPEKNITLHIIGLIDSMAVYPLYDFKIWMNFQALEYVPLLTDVALGGDFAANCRIYSKSDNVDILIFDGAVDFRNLNARIGRDIAVYGIHGSVPFSQMFDLENSLLVSSSRRSLPAWYLPLFSQMEPYLSGVVPYYSTLQIDSVRAMQYRIADIKAQMSFANGLVNIPQLSMKLYEGNVAFQCLIDLGSGSLEDMSYQFRSQIARINSAKFPGTATAKEESAEIAGTINFSGRGLAPGEKMEVEGELQITDIGSQATDNLLKSIDPRGAEQNIKYVRRLIGLGFKPKLLSFPVRHGNFYPTFELRQPWYIPIRIAGGKVAIPRIPMQFILDMVSTQSSLFDKR